MIILYIPTLSGHTVTSDNTDTYDIIGRYSSKKKKNNFRLKYTEFLKKNKFSQQKSFFDKIIKIFLHIEKYSLYFISKRQKKFFSFFGKVRYGMREITILVWEKQYKKWELFGIYTAVDTAYKRLESIKQTAIICNADYVQSITEKTGYEQYFKGLKFDGKIELDKRCFNTFS